MTGCEKNPYIFIHCTPKKSNDLQASYAAERARNILSLGGSTSWNDQSAHQVEGVTLPNVG